MPGKYRIESALVLSTSIGPQSGFLSGVEDAEGVEDYEDSSSWDEEHVVAAGGVVEFTLTASSEDDARDRAETALRNAYFTGDDIEWEIEDYSISNIEVIEEPMNMERALTLIRAYLDYEVQSGRIDAETRSAFDFVIDTITP
jgi:hypothetical protein